LASVWSRILQLRDYIGPFILGTPHGDKALRQLFGGGPSHSGMVVTEELALNLSAVWSAIQVLAGDLGTLPLHHFRKVGRGKEKLDSTLDYLLHDEPNPEMTSAVFRETIMQYALLWGNGLAEIQWDNANRPYAIWPLEPWRVSPDRVNGKLVIRVTRKDGRQDTLDYEDVVHIPNLTSDGVWGRSTIRHAKESLGLAMATEKFGAAFFGNGSTMGGVLIVPQELSDTARENLLKSYENLHKGVDRSFKMMVLEGGSDFKPFVVPPEAAQFLATRQFQVTEIARWFGVPPHKIADLSRSTFSNIEQQNAEYVQQSVTRWIVRWEMELRRKLIGRLERNTQTVEFNLTALLRGDTTTRFASYAVGRQWGFYSVNDIREKEGMNLLDPEIGDTYLVPTNMVPADRLGELIDKQVEPTPPPAPVQPPQPPAENKPAEEEQKSAALGLAARNLAQDLVRRMLRREADKVVSAVGDPEKLADVYAKFGDTFRQQLLPVCQMFCAMTGDKRTPQALAEELVGAHVTTSKRALENCKPEEVEALVEKWQIERLSVIPDILQGASNA
jgi:HK97 family phage portal protein